MWLDEGYISLVVPLDNELVLFTRWRYRVFSRVENDAVVVTVVIISKRFAS